MSATPVQKGSNDVKEISSNEETEDRDPAKLQVRLPQSIEEAVLQAQWATRYAIQEGYTRLIAEINVPDLVPTYTVAKVSMPICWEFMKSFEEYGKGAKVFLPDAGAAALARRDWPDAPFTIAAIGDPVEKDDSLLVFVASDSYQIAELEKVADSASPAFSKNSIPMILLNPNLEDIAVVGIGLAARGIRERFLSTFEKVYYLTAGENYALFRLYPKQWMVWLEEPEDYTLIAEVLERPSGEQIQSFIDAELEKRGLKTKPKGIFGELGSFLRALSR